MNKDKISKILNANSNNKNISIKKEKESEVLENELNKTEEEIKNLFGSLFDDLDLKNEKKDK